MTVSNQELARRADIALADLTANGGVMSPEQTESFIDLVYDQPTILKQVRQVRMNAPEVKLNRIGFDTRILRAAAQSGGANDAGSNDRYVLEADRSKPTTSQIALNSSEIIAEVRIPYELLEDNIEGESFESHVMRLIAERAAIDLEEFALHADTASGDAYLALQNGYLKRMTSHVVNNASAGVSPTMFKNGLLAVPQRYLRNLPSMKHFVSMANTIKYRDLVSQRATGYGDTMLTTAAPIYAHGVSVEGAPMLAAVSGGENLGFLTMPKNLIFGLRRSVSVETDKDIRSREIIIVLTLRAGLQIETEDACVKYTNV